MWAFSFKSLLLFSVSLFFRKNGASFLWDRIQAKDYSINVGLPYKSLLFLNFYYIYYVSSFKVARTTSGLTLYTGLFGTNDGIHLLKRTMFGALKAGIDYFKKNFITGS